MTTNKDKPKTKAFDEWAKDKSPLMRMASLLIAGSADEILILMQKLKMGERIENYFLLPSINQWLKLYKRHKRIHKVVSASFREISQECAETIDFYDVLMDGLHETGKRSNEEVRKELESAPPEIISEIKKTLVEHEKILLESLIEDDTDRGKRLDDKEAKRIRQIFNKPEIIFYLRVWCPCFLLYGTYPTYLLRKARQDDEDAIEKLLRLDKSVIDDPMIKETFYRAAVAQQRGKMDLMTKALAKSPRAKIDIQTVKYTLAGLISLISIALGQKLQAVKIHRLFDAIAADAGKGAIDEDLIVSPETFEKAVQRARSFWQVPRIPDKK